MSEFKGTKGKWEVDRYNNVTIGYSEIAFLNSATKNHERRYNALLISKAPDMLRALEYLINETNFQSHFPTTAIKIKELIKSATEI